MTRDKNPSMITINLLPKDRARVSLDWLPRVVAAVAMVLIVGSVLAVNFYYAVGNLQLRQDKSQLERQIASIQADVQRVRAMEQEIEVLHRKEGIIKDLVLNRIEWARKLNQLSDILPARVWLENVALVQEKNSARANKNEPPKKVLRLVGATRALDHARSLEAALIYNIMHSPFMEDFETVQLVKSELDEWKGGSKEIVWTFEIQLPLKSRNAASGPPAGTDPRPDRAAGAEGVRT